MIAHLPTGRAGQVLALAFGVVLIGLFWLGAIGPARDLYRNRSDTLAQREVLLFHMRELAATLPSLQTQAANTADAPVPTALLRGASDALAGADLQQHMEEMASAVGASLTSTETLTAEPRGNYRRIGLRVTLSAPWSVFTRLLAAVRESTPRMLVDDLKMSTSKLRGGDEATVMNGGFTVFAFGEANPEENTRRQ
jgi:general secretion pathway protein M